MTRFCWLTGVALALFGLPQAVDGQQVLVEAESFATSGGWKLDTQFIEIMGSPYLLAHGLGKPVEDAVTKVEFPETGDYFVYVRTKDWVARWDVQGQPGKFQILVDGNPVGTTFGTQGADWNWQPGGKVAIKDLSVTLRLHDLTGFDGRCDAILFTKQESTPSNDPAILPRWRRELLGLPEEPTKKDGYDVVVVGGGYSGVATALSAGRMGCRVALIQNRPVLGGNGSSEVRVWSMGLIRRGRYPRIGEIVDEFCDHARKSPGKFEEFGDDHKERIVRQEKNVDLFLNHHAYKVEASGFRIDAVYAFDTRTSEHKRFEAPLFVDCTGHGTIGYLAKADWDMTPKGRMGMSNMWAWAEGDKDVPYPKTPWALDLSMKDFPYPRDHHGQWFWEGGFDRDPIKEAEYIRDWNLRAVYGAFNAMKNRDGAAKHGKAFLTWIAYIGGPRESRRLMGDVVLTQEDIVSKREFKDGCVPSTWSIDLHYPKKQYSQKYPKDPFISIAVHDRRIDRSYGYPVPYRCFYSRNIDNLFMAGRCISVTHQALGTTRVMKTCGMMGEVVGRATSICTKHQCSPREVYTKYLSELDILLKLPGKAYRDNVESEMIIPKDVLPLAGKHGPPTGIPVAKLAGIVVDDIDAKKEGRWTNGTGLKGYVGWGYVYAAAHSKSRIEFPVKITKAGRYEVRVAYQPHENRSAAVTARLLSKQDEITATINMKQPPPIDNGFISLGVHEFVAGETATVELTTAGANGNVHADAVQFIPVP